MPHLPGINQMADKRGFTLVEMLVSTAIITVLVLMMGQIVENVSTQYSTVQAQTDQRQKVRAIADYVATDLSAALLPINPDSDDNLQFILNPPTLSATLKAPSAIFWQAPIATDRSRGDIAEVGYFVRWIGNQASLCRFFVNPVTSGSENLNFRIYSNPQDWISDSLASAIAPADKTGEYAGLFAENVIGIWANCLDPNGNAIIGSNGSPIKSGDGFDSRLNIDKTNKGAYKYTDAITNKVCYGRLPASVDFSFVLLDPRAAAKIGDSQHSDIVDLIGSPEVTDAVTFVQEAQKKSSLRMILPSLHACKTTIHLSNAK
jgi:prepilin-type N-terminal cleavage/methylation domain-containing protein